MRKCKQKPKREPKGGTRKLCPNKSNLVQVLSPDEIGKFTTSFTDLLSKIIQPVQHSINSILTSFLLAIIRSSFELPMARISESLEDRISNLERELNSLKNLTEAQIIKLQNRVKSLEHPEFPMIQKETVQTVKETEKIVENYIVEHYNIDESFFPSEIAIELGIPYEAVHQVLETLMKNGKLRLKDVEKV